MSLLAPLYFFGALAVGLPILFHLIRRRPKGEVEFSSLMFLRPTPPRLTRKSRLENLPLLLIRALALILLAAAFARPFFRSTAISDSDIPARRMVLVIDTSASMRRDGLWQQALDKSRQRIDDLRPADQLAIVTFDSAPKTLLGFEQSGGLSLPQRKSTAKALIDDVAPSWQPTDTGRAISYAADLAVSYEPEDPAQDDGAAASKPLSGPAHMILISDMQAGSQIESLQVYAWPDRLRLDVEPVIARQKTNASAQILEQTQSDDDQARSPESQRDDRIRVRVANSADATESRFRIRWAGENGAELPVQVPPGQSRVVRMPPPDPGVTSLLVSGDQVAFDNQRYIVSPEPEPLTLLHIGPVAEQPRESLLYYLKRVPLSNRRRNVTVQSKPATELAEPPDAKSVPLVVVEGTFGAEVGQRLADYLSAGGNVLYVFADPQDLDQAESSVNGLIASVDPEGGRLSVEEVQIDDYAMLSGIDFSDPLFAPMSDPQFNDFTKIRFWEHRKISGLDDRWRVPASFDDQDPALIQRPVGDGNLWVLATGWQPSQSQLALSTKFIPLMFSLFDTSGGRRSVDRFTIGGPIDLPASPTATIVRPEGTALEYRTKADLEAIDRPGVYRFRDGSTERPFAVNLSGAESRTEAITDTELERFGVQLGSQLSAAETLARERQLRDVELESQQRLWQWLLVAALGLLALETLLGGWLSRRRSREAEPILQT